MTNALFLPEAGFAEFEATTLFVRGLRVEAEIGVNAHERGRSQTLLVDLDIVVAPVRVDRIGATFDYDKVLGLIGAVTAAGHVDLVETFAKLIGQALLANEPVRRVTIRITKPSALAQAGSAVGVELRLTHV